MKRKYIYILAIAVVLVAMLAIPAMQKPKVTVPENPFPISEEAINTAIKNAGLELTLGEKTVLDNETNNLTAYFLMNKDNKITAFLQMSYFGERKHISIFSQPSYGGSRGVMPAEDFPKLSLVVSEIYGGFEDNNTAYNDFLSEADLENNKKINWLKKYGNIYYSISLQNADDGGNLNLIDRVDSISVGITNEAGLQSDIEASETLIKNTEERLKNFPERDTKEERDRLQDYKDSLERLKAIK